MSTSCSILVDSVNRSPCMTFVVMTIAFLRPGFSKLKYVLIYITAMGLVACASWGVLDRNGAAQRKFSNHYVIAEDKGERPNFTYFFRRAWVQITRDMNKTELPGVVPLDISALGQRQFALAWFGHSSMLLRAGTKWILIDPVLSDTAGPVAGFGPKRLTPLPFPIETLPHIDIVLISHDHYDHLDLSTMRRLAKQKGGAPMYATGRGLRAWFDNNVGVRSEEFDWWQSIAVDDVTVRFVPAQHFSGRTPWSKNETLWGGWVVEHDGSRFYYAGDTSYVDEMFRDIRARVGPIDLAALPIGAYEPRRLMRFDHLNPDDAVRAHLDIESKQSVGVHWATFQLGDEEPIQPSRDLVTARTTYGVNAFDVLTVGAVLDVPRLGTMVMR